MIAAGLTDQPPLPSCSGDCIAENNQSQSISHYLFLYLSLYLQKTKSISPIELLKER